MASAVEIDVHWGRRRIQQDVRVRMPGTKLHCRLLLTACLLAVPSVGAYAQAQPAPPNPPATATAPADTAPAPQTPAPATPTDQVERGAGGQFVLHQSTEEVVLNATVVDQNQQLVETLDKPAFQVFEDGAPQTILGFRREDIPVSLGILIDSSGSMYNKVDSVRTAAMDLIKASNKEDETFIVNFSEEAYIDQDLTSDVGKLSSALNLFHVAGGTAIYDTVVASADYLSQNAKKPKQVLLIITDGDDRDSSSNLETTIRRVQDLNGPVVYCIGLLFGADDMDHDSIRHSRRVLQSLADQTGGLAFFPKRVEDVDAIAQQVAQDIRSQYTISYHSTRPSSQPGYRQIHVEAKAKGWGKLTVRTRNGYFPKRTAVAGGDAGLQSKQP